MIMIPPGSPLISKRRWMPLNAPSESTTWSNEMSNSMATGELEPEPPERLGAMNNLAFHLHGTGDDSMGLNVGVSADAIGHEALLDLGKQIADQGVVDAQH